jgi:hypothetical protein
MSGRVESNRLLFTKAPIYVLYQRIEREKSQLMRITTAREGNGWLGVLL